jgi:hypothetical protein
MNFFSIQAKFDHVEYLLVDNSEPQDESKPQSLAKVCTTYGIYMNSTYISTY